MMTSVGTNRARGNWEQPQNQNQTQHKQRPQATAEQIRLAQMISDHNDADFEEKVKQLIDITGKNQDECVIALHDCNGDVNRAINVLLEGNPDTFEVRKMDWMAPRVEGLLEEEQKEAEGAVAEAEVISLLGDDIGGRTFNPADYAEPANTDDNYGNSSGNTWNNTGHFEPDDGTSAWRTATEEWGTEDWNEDVSMLGKGFGDVGEAKGGSTTGSQFLEQFKTAQALAQLAAQHSQSGSTTTSSWDMGSTTQSPSLVQYDLKNPSDSTVHSPFTKRQAFTPSSTMMEVFLQEKSPAVATSTAAPPPPSSPLPSKSTSAPQMSPGSSDNQSSSPQPAQQKLKQQKKKASLTSKIPALAVEMPGSADISGLNLQFGALQFGSEPVLSDYESTPTTSASSSQAPSSLYTSTASESSSTISSNQSQESGYQSGPIQSTTYTSQNNAQGPLYEQRSTQTRRYPSSISSSPQKDLTQAKNGFSSVQATQLQTTQSVEGATGSAVKSDSPSTSSIPPLNETVSAASLLTTTNQHSSSLGGLSHSEEIPNTTTTQHSSTLSTQQNTLSSSTSSGRTSTSTLLHTSVESEANLHSSSSTFSTTSSTVSAPPPVVSVSSSLNSGSSLGLSLGSNSTVTASTRSSVATTSGKAPPNLPPGVPPLLPNPYIMAPGLLHAYPPQVYGYDDLQMLQTRFPLDYYSIPFPTPTTPLTGRDGSLASNPYSGDLTKFGRGDASSPAPATTLAQPQQNQTQTHHTTQQTFLNPALPPGYSYTSLPYYTGVPGLPSTFQYGPAVFPVAPTSSKQHGVNVSVNASATPFQQPSGYGSHGYNTGVSVTSSNTGVPDISGSVYSKTQQSFEKQGFHSGTPAASFNLPSALGSGGPINPATAAAYPPAPFMHILTPHQQPHSQILHHHLQQDGQLPYLQMILCCQRQQEEQTGSGQRSQTSSIPQKPQTNKSAYNSYSWGAN
ncbi:UBAP2L isoform 11 [Pongo abelii]|uniref:UBAP2L isoform 11 n=1 Tax=Pongo abelii TaxID=9601 RepID=A0A2J8VFX9_PONAB|nr:UBAP2L isoform 11 [Pongo abelii]